MTPLSVTTTLILEGRVICQFPDQAHPLDPRNVAYLDPKSGEIWMRDLSDPSWEWVCATVPKEKGILFSPYREINLLPKLGGEALRLEFLRLTSNLKENLR